jgi:hypothetical protein
MARRGLISPWRTTGRWRPLLRTTRALTIRMTFAEVEAITGKLPPSARTVRQWWENDPDKPQAREGWLAAGYETTAVSIKEQRVELVAPATSARGRGSPSGP